MLCLLVVLAAQAALDTWPWDPRKTDEAQKDDKEEPGPVQKSSKPWKKAAVAGGVLAALAAAGLHDGAGGALTPGGRLEPSLSAALRRVGVASPAARARFAEFNALEQVGVERAMNPLHPVPGVAALAATAPAYLGAKVLDGPAPLIAALGAALAQQGARHLRGWQFRAGRGERATDFQAFKKAEYAYVRKYGQDAFRAQLGVQCEGCDAVEAQRRAFAAWRGTGGAELAAPAAPKKEKPPALERFQPGPPPPLSGADLKRVEAGESVTSTVKTPDGGARAMAVFDIPAAPEAVWAAIQDLSKYPKLVSGVLGVQVYDGPKKSGSATVTKAKFTAGMMGYKLSYNLEMKYEPNQNSLTFHLDQSRENDFNDMIGKWHVAAIEGPDGRVKSRVTYQTALQLAVPVPPAIQNILIKSTIGKATSWVAPEAARLEAQ